MRLRKVVTTMGAATVSLALGGFAASPAFATIPMQKAAKGAGVSEATKCTHCHGEALPKKGASTLNDRGKWLVAEKDKRKASEVDGAWLKDYKEPEKK